MKKNAFRILLLVALLVCTVVCIMSCAKKSIALTERSATLESKEYTALAAAVTNDGEIDPCATKHVYTATVIAPTCTTRGYSVYACVCGRSYVSDFIPATGHSYVKTVVEATCKMRGYTQYECECGVAYKTDFAPAQGHIYLPTEIAPTCGTRGYTLYACTCGLSYKGNFVPVSGEHVMGPEATCTEPQTCTGCGKVYSEALGHVEEIIPGVDATCTESGLTEGTYCSVCDEVLVEQEVIAAGHKYVDGECTACGEAEQVTVYTESFAIAAADGDLSGDFLTISWASDNFDFVGAKANSTVNIRTSDTNHFRVYAGSTFTISANADQQIIQVVITCTSADYASICANSLSTRGATATVSGKLVTVTVDNATVNEIVFDATAQWRLSNIEISYISAGGSVETPTGDEPTEEPTEPTDHPYTDFTGDEKSAFEGIFGLVIPFIPNDEYYVADETEYYGFEVLNFYAYGNTYAEFESYLDKFSSYTNEGSDTDDYGDTWYFFSKGSVVVQVAYYLYEGEYIVDVYVYHDDTASEDPTDPPSDNPYGTLEDPLTATEVLNANSGLASGESSENIYYLKGTVTSIGTTGNYYKNVYISDGITDFLVYTVNMGSGISGFEVGDVITVYGYVKNYNGTIEMATKYVNNDPVYVMCVKVEQGSGDNGGGNGGSGDHTYTDFTSSEKAMFEQMFGFVIPFVPNDDYYVDDQSELFGFDILNFYTFGNTSAEFSAYLDKFSSFDSDGTEIDEDGDTWYLFSKGDICIDVSYYLYDGEYVIDVYVYNEGSSGGSGDNSGGTTTDADVITNDGKGLPEDDGDGIYDIDFSDAENVKNVTDQGYYLDGCPTTGSVPVLVIPVEFSDVTAQSKGYTLDNLEKIFNGGTQDIAYYSVHDYFYASSYGLLDLEITVLDEWFRPENSSSYYANSTMDYYGYEVANGDQLILDEALAYLSTFMDLSEFDSDNNGTIDAVILVNTLEIGEEDFYWAYRYWNLLGDDDGNYYEYDNVFANDYVWLSYQFMFESYDDNGNVNYDSSNELNPYTFIHEFSHALGCDDYYDTSYTSNPLEGLDIMDAMVGDHNPYSKFNFGWITESRLVTAENSVTVALEAFSKSGDTIIIANNWDPTLGAYQEYFVIMYYTSEGLNGDGYGYFMRDGVVVYHINASLYAEEIDGEIYYDVYNNNTNASDSYGTENNLIEYVLSANDTYTYIEGDTMSDAYDDAGNRLGYTFTVDSIDGDAATLTFSVVG